jgi:oligopeptide/dipeptide ABC transporter ATP-binding protein
VNASARAGAPGPAVEASVLVVEKLRAYFETRRGRVQAIDDVSFELAAGEILALVGESGSGKSATALAIAGLLPRPPAVIETGRVALGGVNLLELPERALAKFRGKDLATVFQDPSGALHPLKRIGAQIAEVLLLHERVGERAARDRCARALAEVGMPDPAARLDLYPHELSGGQRQRALIAMALIARPRVLIADEPTTALDTTVQAEIVALFERVRREHGTAILWITHDLGLVARAADRVHVMYAGALVETGATEQVFARPAHPYTRALLDTARALERRAQDALPAIPGAPPDLARLPRGCAFAPRCAWRRPHCEVERPRLEPVAPTAGAVRRFQRPRAGARAACFERERVAAGGAP